MEQPKASRIMPTNEEPSRSFARVAASAGQAAQAFCQLGKAIERLEREEPELMALLREKG